LRRVAGGFDGRGRFIFDVLPERPEREFGRLGLLEEPSEEADAACCGSQSHFGRAFHRKFGLTPTARRSRETGERGFESF
jgi:hypothetical protein